MTFLRAVGGVPGCSRRSRRGLVSAVTVAALAAGCQTGTRPSSDRLAASSGASPAQGRESMPIEPPSPSPSGAVSTASAPPLAVGGPVTPEDMAADARGERAFAAKLHGALAKTASGNLFVSPASVRLAFGLVHAGAREGTAKELADLFGYTPKTADVAAALARDWAKLGETPKEEWRQGEVVTITSANRLFVARSLKLLPEYEATTRDRWAAPAELVDFAADPEAARGVINAWVAKNTRDKIKDILAPRTLTRDTKLALANAIYFRASWRYPFEVSETKPGPFQASGGPVTVPMMTHLDHGKVGDTSEAEIVELPYGRDFVMTIVLPRAGLAAVEGAISEEKLRAWASAPVPVRKLRVTMPKFRVESTLGLAETMRALGVTRVFEYGKSDLSGIDGTHDLFVGTAIHKTFVAVDEKGTEAAAATVIGMEAGAAPDNSPPREFKVDRPFLFAVRDAKRDRLVFLGRVTDPTK